MPTQSTREQIYAALFTKLQAIPGINFFTRRDQAFASLSSDQQPALAMVQAGEHAEKTTGLPIKWRLHVNVGVFVSTGGDVQNTVPDQVLNPILDAVEASLLPGPNNDYYQTLGVVGIVEARIKGPVEIFPGDLNTQALMKIPIEILAL